MAATREHAGRQGNGFTLVEVLIVIAIIGLLVSLALPSFVKARDFTRRTQCLAHLRGAGVAVRMYLNGSKEVMPIAAYMPSLRLNDEPRIADVLAPYLGDEEILRCPADTHRDFFASEGSSYAYNTMLGGRKVSGTFLSRRLGDHQTPVLYDYEPFHGPAGTPGAANYLFADGHVGDLN